MGLALELVSATVGWNVCADARRRSFYNADPQCPWGQVSFSPWHRGVDHWDSEPEAVAQSQSRKGQSWDSPPGLDP